MRQPLTLEESIAFYEQWAIRATDPVDRLWNQLHAVVAKVEKANRAWTPANWPVADSRDRWPGFGPWDKGPGILFTPVEGISMRWERVDDGWAAQPSVPRFTVGNSHSDWRPAWAAHAARLALIDAMLDGLLVHALRRGGASDYAAIIDAASREPL